MSLARSRVFSREKAFSRVPAIPKNRGYFGEKNDYVTRLAEETIESLN